MRALTLFAIFLREITRHGNEFESVLDCLLSPSHEFYLPPAQVLSLSEMVLYVATYNTVERVSPTYVAFLMEFEIPPPNGG